MTWSRLIIILIIIYVAAWLSVETARQFFASTYPLWAHELLLSVAICAGLIAASLAAEEWVDHA